ncbi:MAG: CvpA family protein [Candidatus Symbiothrix sp.]|nr:CvpA family protein [Candidatus Symbiothrix sp.]
MDIVIIACVVIGLIKGFFNGFIKQAVSFLALILALFFTGQFALFLRGWLQQFDAFSSLNQGILSATCYIFAFVLIIIAIVLIGKIVNIAIKMTPARILNILLGGLFSALIWILSLSIVFNLLSVFGVQLWLFSPQTQSESIFYDEVKAIVPTIYPFMKDYFY